MAAWVAQINSVTPSGQSLNIQVTYYLATDVSFTTPLGTSTVTVPSNLSAGSIQKQIIAAGTDYRSGYNLTATYQGTTVNIP